MEKIMPNSKRFNATVKVGGKSYPPGEDVPLGGKSGLPKGEAERIEEQFGEWKGRTLSDAEKISHLAKENQNLEAQLSQANSDKEGIQAKLDQAESDNAVLAARVEELEGASKDGGKSAENDGGGTD